MERKRYFSGLLSILFLGPVFAASVDQTMSESAGHSAMAVAQTSSKSSVEEIYQEFCSVCHGDAGDGKSRASGGLMPPPRDFTTPTAGVELTRERMIQSIAEGRPGTAMSGWKGRLSGEEIAGVADYIRVRFMPSSTTEISSDGRRIFAEYCSVCHGDRGQGAVWAQSGLNPPPANFTDPVLQKELTRERMIFSVTYGRPQTAMSSWKKRLNDDEIESVVDYVRQSIMGVREESMPMQHAEAKPEAAMSEEHDHDAHGLENLNDPMPLGLTGDAEAGLALYERSCVACHGLKGDGQGPRAYFIFPKPRDFRHPAARAKYSRVHLYEVISKGVIGSEMPAWNKVLSKQEIADLSEYVFHAFIRPES